MNTTIPDKLKRPLYIYVYDELLLLISKGEFPVGSRLPSEPDLAKKLGVSRATLRQALALLQDDGLVRNIRGKGNFVIDSFYKQQASVQLEKLSNPMHKCHISTFDRIDTHYRLETQTEYTKQVLKRDLSGVAAIERLYRKGNDLVGYAFTFMSMETVERLSLDLDNKELLLDFLENQAYENANHGEMEIKYTHTVNLADQKEKLIGRNECFLLLESLYGNADYPLMYNKFYIPQQFSNIKLNIYK
ncbi:GntR family transcriptional regulator [Neobacillus mesonae]|uniref:GntR family transcriptional regulator n=1 Tax=Neobacillus mesonae TaxID=1193713 RepID=A0A3T0I4S1_9BACI|nr:GntR family transcriptional regulator [Neobacillus mesonae]AZU64364.1 GntR family transcriptional regulator [Neobacillus mesonae]MED4203550.1 GntR family transcriptional regulator [Neobacillus mesonae]